MLQVESDELVAKVQGNEVPVEYIVFDDEGHGSEIEKTGSPLPMPMSIFLTAT